MTFKHTRNSLKRKHHPDSVFFVVRPSAWWPTSSTVGVQRNQESKRNWILLQVILLFVDKDHRFVYKGWSFDSQVDLFVFIFQEKSVHVWKARVPRNGTCGSSHGPGRSGDPPSRVCRGFHRLDLFVDKFFQKNFLSKKLVNKDIFVLFVWTFFPFCDPIKILRIWWPYRQFNGPLFKNLKDKVRNNERLRGSYHASPRFL